MRLGELDRVQIFWSTHHVNWNSIVGTWGRSGSHSLPFIQFGSSEGVHLFSCLSAHGHQSRIYPFAPDVLPLPRPSGIALPRSFRVTPPPETCRFFTLLTLDLKAPDLLSRKILDHALSNSNKWARGAAVEVLSLIRKVFQMRCEWPADKNSALSWAVWVCWWKKIIVWKMILLKWCCVFTSVKVKPYFILF